jgi:heme-degrading monooxygenase HmoA
MHAVIFTSKRTTVEEGYAEANDRLMDLVQTQPGFQGSESWRNSDGYGITIVYFDSAEGSRAWGEHPDHREAQRLGREKWYSEYRIQVCKVERDWNWKKEN